MEVTIAMLLSAICISICYTAYGIIGNYYAKFQQKNQTANTVLALRQVLARDFLKSKLIIHHEDGLELQQDGLSIYYNFSPETIQRRLNEEHTDTFSLKYHDLRYTFEGREIMVADTIDQLNFKIILDSLTTVPVQFNKKYSAENLFK
jgi:hypothetical protein